MAVKKKATKRKSPTKRAKFSEEPAEEVKTVSADKYTKAKVRLDPGAFVMVDVFGRGRR